MGLGEVFRLFATLGIDATEFDQRLSQAEQKLNTVAQGFTSAGRTLTVGVTAPIVGLGTAALHSSVSFESAFAGVRKTVDATEEQFEQLSDGIRDMTRRMPVSAEEIARVAEAAGQLGIQADDVLEFTEVMIGLGEATADMLPEEAAMQIARFMNIMQTGAGDVDRLASTVVDLGNNLAATEGEITLMGMRLAGAGKLIGLTEAEVLGLAGTMTSLGIRAEAGGTAMSRVMREIMNAVMGGGEELETFAGIAGVSAEEFAAAFTGNPITAIQLFSDGLGRIRDEGGNVNEALENVSLQDIRVSDALLRMSGSGELLANSINLATNAWSENTALTEEVNRRYETTESQLNMLKNSMQEVVRTIGDALVPFLMAVVEAAKPLIAALQSLAEWFGNLNPVMQGFIIGGAGIVAAIGPILWMIGSFAGAISNLLPLLSMIPGAFGAIRTALGLLTGPVGWIITAIGLIAAAWATDFLGLRSNFEENWGKVKQVLQATWEFLRGVGERIAQVVTDMVTAFRGLLSGAKEATDAVRSAFMDWWDRLWEFLKGLPQKMLDFGKDLIQGLINGVRSMVTGAVDAVKGVGESVINGFKNLLGIESPSRVFYQFGLDIGEGLALGIEASERRVQTAVDRLAAATAGGRQGFGSRTIGGVNTNAWVDAAVGDLEGRDAILALQRALGELEVKRRGIFDATHGSTAAALMRDMLDWRTRTLEDALDKLREELYRSRINTAREAEVQTRRFSMAVGMFDTGVRGLQLARQRY